MQYISHYNSPLGRILLAADGEYLTGLWFEGQKYFARGLDREHGERHIPLFETAAQWLDLYFSGREPDFSVPIRLAGTPFQNEVWGLLRTIPYGRTVTYGELSRRIAAKRGLAHMSAQAVGGAVGRNPISIIVPCHRVVGSDGNLTGYAGGLDKKVKLLTLERADMTSLSVPKSGTAVSPS